MLLRQELLGKGPLQSRGGTTGSVGFHIKYKLQPDCLVLTKKSFEYGNNHRNFLSYAKSFD